MALGLENKATAINSITDDIKEKFPQCMDHTMCFLSGGAGPLLEDSMVTFDNSSTATVVIADSENFTWVFLKDITPFPVGEGNVITVGGSGTITKAESIEDVIDNCILLKLFNLVTLGMDKLKEMFKDFFSGIKSYSAPCGADKLLDGSQIGDARQEYMDVVDKLQSGDMFDTVHTKLQEAYMNNVDDCYGLYQKLSEICSSMDALGEFLDSILNALKRFEDLIDKALMILGAISAILSCGQEVMDMFGAKAPWVGELNSDMSTTLNAVTEAKQATSSPQAAMSYAKQKSATDLGVDLEAIDAKNELINIKALF